MVDTDRKGFGPDMKKLAILAALLALPLPSVAHDAPDPESLRATVEKLVSFGTRHSLSATDDPTRGIGAARKWGAEVFHQISRKCGDCLTVEEVGREFSGSRAPDGVRIANVMAIQPGRMGWDHVIMIAGHIDSRASDPLDFTGDAPGANDDGSGTALVIEAAKVLSHHQFDATIVYALLSGEEQGLWGGELLAETARERGWHVSAMLNNDIVGNSIGTDGRKVDDRVRVFSEGIRASEDQARQSWRRASGAEDDGPSRALMRAISRAGARNPQIGLEIFGVRRPDRFGRGGDHLPSLEFGFPAVRFTVGVENYHQQHQDVRAENGIEYGDTPDKMDFDYLAKVTAVNIATIRELASAPPAPASALLSGAVSSDSHIEWTPVKGASRYKVYWRRADRQDWEGSMETTDTRLSFPGMIVDDHFFGVAALSPQGHESIVTFGTLTPPK